MNTMFSYGIVVHGGAGSSVENTDGCRAACEAGLSVLEKGSAALDAVVEAVRVLEDDERFNAGTGSVLRIDGKTIEMDAAVMDSEGKIGAVMGIQNVKNPVLVAREVLSTPHLALAGKGAEAFARARGFGHYSPLTDKALRQFEKVKKLIAEGKLGEYNPRWRDVDPSLLKDLASSDTVGAVALDRQGIFAVASSTGGASPMMVGRVGDTPLIGCGFYAGVEGAVTATGIGEEIIKRMLSKTVYDLIAQVNGIEKACASSINLFPTDIAVGIIAISREGYAVESNREMAHYALMKES